MNKVFYGALNVPSTSLCALLFWSHDMFYDWALSAYFLLMTLADDGGYRNLISVLIPTYRFTERVGHIMNRQNLGYRLRGYL